MRPTRLEDLAMDELALMVLAVADVVQIEAEDEEDVLLLVHTQTARALTTPQYCHLPQSLMLGEVQRPVVGTHHRPRLMHQLGKHRKRMRAIGTLQRSKSRIP
jgi:hypothetical protein